MQQKKLLFIINPISGHGKQKVVGELLQKHLDSRRFSYEIIYTEYAGHATEITAQHKNDFDTVVAVGGDGSINEVGQALINTSTSLGIIPFGSGNGFARHLNIPLQAQQAIEMLQNTPSRSIDTFSIQNQVALNVAGVGFDAHIAHCFEAAPTRGLSTYAKLSVKEFFRYKPTLYKITVDGVVHEHVAFSVSVANSTQFGNNALISPQAKIDDGLLDLVILKPFPLVAAARLSWQLFSGKLHQSPYFLRYTAKNISIATKQDMPAHIDGEAVSFGSEINAEVLPFSLSVIAP